MSCQKKENLAFQPPFEPNGTIVFKYFNPFQDDKILAWSKMKQFAEDKIDVVKMMISLLDRVENTGKRRKCWLPAFSPFPTVFSKAFFLPVVKSGLCCKGLIWTRLKSWCLVKGKHVSCERRPYASWSGLILFTKTTIAVKETLALVCSTSLLKTLWEKKKLLGKSNFSFSHCVFYPFKITSCHFSQMWSCRLQTLSI